MAEKKTRKGRWSHLSQFQRTVSGEYIYTGMSYRCTLERGDFLRRRVLLALMGLGLLALTLTGGCIRAPGVGNCPYVLLPYVAELAAGVSLCWALGQLAAGGPVLREYVYQASAGKIPRRAMLTALAAGASAAGECIYLALHPDAEALPEGICFLLLTVCAAGLAFAIKFLTAALPWEKFSADFSKK